MNIPFATTADVEARWRELDADESARAAQLLEDASVMLADCMDSRGVDWQSASVDSDDLLGRSIRMVTAAMVARALNRPTDVPAVTQYSEGAVGYSASMTFANPQGDLYATKRELRLIGCGGMRIGAVRPKCDPRHRRGWRPLWR